MVDGLTEHELMDFDASEGTCGGHQNHICTHRRVVQRQWQESRSEDYSIDLTVSEHVWRLVPSGAMSPLLSGMHE